MVDCVRTPNYELYEEALVIDLGIDDYLGTQLLLWFIIFVPMLLISVGISCIFGKCSDKLFGVPFINKETVKFDEFHLEDAKGFRGFLPKLTAFVKAITLSGIIFLYIITFVMLFPNNIVIFKLQEFY